MRWMDKLRLRLRSVFGRSAVERELGDELRFHLEKQIEENRAKGMTAEQARQAALRGFGGVEQVKEECRDARGWNFLGDAWRDARLGARLLRKSPGFAGAAILTLAVGIGANTAVFSVVNGVLLNPLPYPHPGQLVALAETLPPFPQFAISYPDFLDWERMNHAFQSLAAYRQNNFTLTGWGEAQRVKAMQVSAAFFPLLGVKPALGRDFSPEEDTRGGQAVVMISEGLWKTKFGGSPGILNEALTLDGKQYRIIGVVPASFYFCCDSTNFRLGDVYLPVGQWNVNWMQDRSAHPGLFAVGRLKPGVTLEKARADMAAISANLSKAYPDADKGSGAVLTPLKARMVGGAQPMLLILLAAVGFVLALGCVNVASLLLSRSAAREREFALRAALGATPGRVARQLLVESLLVAAVGGAAGLLLAAWGTRAALAALPSALPRSNDVRTDLHVLLFALGASALAGVLAGLAPALGTWRRDVQGMLKAHERSGAARTGVQGTFVAVEMALAVVLLVGAGLMIRSLAELRNANPGFDSHNVLTFTVGLPPTTSRGTPAQVRAAVGRLTRTIAAVPGVQAAAITDGAFPFNGDDEVGFWAQGQPEPAGQSDMTNALNYIVGPDYLQVMRIPLLRGRFFTAQDNLHSPLVAVIDENLARAYFAHQDPVGKTLHLAGFAPPLEIVGVVGHVAQWGLDENPQSTASVQIYTPISQVPDEFISLLAKQEGYVVRTEAASASAEAAIRQAIAKAGGDEVAYDFEPMRELVSGSLAARRFSMILMSVFAGLAVFLAGIGIYGVVSYQASRRTHEIGIRLALGAERGRVLRMILGQGAKFAAAGVVVGVCAAFGLTHLMASLLFGVTARDPLTFALVAAFLTGVALLACYVPARRAMRVDPVTALRHE